MAHLSHVLKPNSLIFNEFSLSPGGFIQRVGHRLTRFGFLHQRTGAKPGSHTHHFLHFFTHVNPVTHFVFIAVFCDLRSLMYVSLSHDYYGCRSNYQHLSESKGLLIEPSLRTLQLKIAHFLQKELLLSATNL